MKSPHNQRPDPVAREMTEEFIAKYAKPARPAQQVEGQKGQQGQEGQGQRSSSARAGDDYRLLLTQRASLGGSRLRPLSSNP